MARMSQMNSIGAALLVAFVISGCQSPNSKWATAWKDRTKPKQKFQGVDGPDEKVTYWPNKPAKSNATMSEVPDRLKDKMARKSEQSKRDTQLTDLIKEGDQLRKNGQLEDARLVYNKANLISPDNPDVNHRLAIVADKQLQYSVADDCYQAALRIRPRDPNLLSDMGYSFYLRGNSQQAEVTLKEALTIDKSHKGAMANLGAIYAQQNRYPEALEMFRIGATETEAQQYIAKLFPQGRSAAGTNSQPNQGNSGAGPIIASKGENPRDLSKLSWEQIQSEMARLKQEERQRRQLTDQQAIAQSRTILAQDTDWQQQSSSPSTAINRSNAPMSLGPQGMGASGNTNNQPGIDLSQQQANATQSPGFNGQGYGMNGSQTARANNSTMPDQSFSDASNNSQAAKIFRGSGSSQQSSRSNDQQIQQAWDQQPANTTTQGNGSNYASQLATQLGMSAGPGSMFPVVPGTGVDGTQTAGSTALNNNRFGADFQRSSNKQTPQNWSSDTNDWASGAGSNSVGNDVPPQSVAPVSPTSNWATPATGGFNWQNGNSNSSASDWTNETQQSGGAGSGGITPIGQTSWGQPANRRMNSPTNTSSNMNLNRPRNDTGGSRPYTGAWPNANSIQQPQSGSVPLSDRAPETLEMMGINPTNANGGAASDNQNGIGGNATDFPNNSLPQYPFAPNR